MEGIVPTQAFGVDSHAVAVDAIHKEVVCAEDAAVDDVYDVALRELVAVSCNEHHGVQG